MTPNDIRALLIKKGISQTDLAAEIGVSVQAVNGVIAGHWLSRRVSEHIAFRLKRPVEKLFPKVAA